MPLLAGYDDQSVYNGVMDGLIAIKLPAPVAASPLVTHQSLSLPSLTVETSNPSGSSFPTARDRKRTHLSTPAICPLIKADKLASTPRLARVTKLFFGRLGIITKTL
ncbi:hypothetical protein DFH28DRAFT_935766 [Melampsora americana]|nr:hypothetical protein DFH28DRAFT_935766 [Melampsora americana]